MSYVLKFKNLGKDKVKLIGKKADSIVSLFNTNFPVPQGFIVTTEAFDAFLKKEDINDKINEILDSINADNFEELENSSRAIRELILNSKIPSNVEEKIKEKYKLLGIRDEIQGLDERARDMLNAGREDILVAVRPSIYSTSNLTFAGLHDSLLNIQGTLGVINAVKNCWASLFNSRAIYYRKKKNIKDINVAIIIQTMINGEKSGSAFTVNPLTANRNELIVESSWGLGKSIVEGIVSPDLYVLDKQTENIVSKRINEKEWEYKKNPAQMGIIKEKISGEKSNNECLNDVELKALLNLFSKVEEHFHSSLKIEWIIQRDKIYVLQADMLSNLDNNYPVDDKEAAMEGIGISSGSKKSSVKILNNFSEVDKIQEGDILVSFIPYANLVFFLDKIGGVITEKGGLSSSLNILCREFKVPSIVLKNATTTLKENEIIEMNGFSGKIFRETPELTLETESLDLEDTITATKIKLTLKNTEVETLNDKYDGVGLIKAESLMTDKSPVAFILEGHELILVQHIESQLEKIAQAFYPKPVWFRTLDILKEEINGHEKNPLMGLRGIRRIDDYSLFKVQMNAIKNLVDKGYNNIGIMLPFVHSPSEVLKAQNIARDVGLDLQRIDFGIMIETPAAGLLAKEFASTGINFVSINSEELTQFVLGVDKDNPKVQNLYNEMHPAVLKIVEQIIKEYKKQKIKISFCGSASKNPEMVEKLVEYGIDSISTDVNSADSVKYVISRAERKLLLDLMRRRDLN